MAVKRASKRMSIACALVLVGGIFVALGGLASFLSATVTGAGNVYGTVSLLGFLFGILLVMAGFEIHSINPRHARKWSGVALIVSLLSLVNFGGFLAGFVLAFLGSYAALVESGRR